MEYNGFAIMKGDTSIEASRLLSYTLLHDIPLLYLNKKDSIPNMFVPCGSVEWIQHLLNKIVIPDYYPEWLSSYLYRDVWETYKFPIGKRVFIKPSRSYKKFNGFITNGGYKGKKKGPYWCSDIVNFINEWRYYISFGKILCSGWYAGDEINTPEPPPLDIKIPNDYCGALDFGMLKDGRFALVESQHPFACGRYGKQQDDYLYFQWVIDGWDYMTKIHKNPDNM